MNAIAKYIIATAVGKHLHYCGLVLDVAIDYCDISTIRPFQQYVSNSTEVLIYRESALYVKAHLSHPSLRPPKCHEPPCHIRPCTYQVSMKLPYMIDTPQGHNACINMQGCLHGSPVASVPVQHAFVTRGTPCIGCTAESRRTRPRSSYPITPRRLLLTPHECQCC